MVLVARGRPAARLRRFLFLAAVEWHGHLPSSCAGQSPPRRRTLWRRTRTEPLAGGTPGQPPGLAASRGMDGDQRAVRDADAFTLRGFSAGLFIRSAVWLDGILDAERDSRRRDARGHDAVHVAGAPRI